MIIVKNGDNMQDNKNTADKSVNENTRVKGEILEIHGTRDFFDNRTNKALPHRYNYVNYQDSNPVLALERDAFEKKKISKYFSVKPDTLILDIGCGVARWGDYFADYLQSGKYVGVDFSESILDIAKKQYEGDDRYLFARESFQNLYNIFDDESIPKKYDIILINGVLTYINDREIDGCLKYIYKIINNGGIIYIKESVGINDRLTLNHFFSKEMDSEYSAIYRSVTQYKNVFDEIFLGSEYQYVAQGDMWEEKLSNRKETSSYFWIIKKNK